jgi:3-hydroxyacyl-CoA dehydrogenase
VQVCTVVGNCPGFVGNRMLFPYKAETDFLIEEGASPYAVDKYETHTTCTAQTGLTMAQPSMFGKCTTLHAMTRLV